MILGYSSNFSTLISLIPVSSYYFFGISFDATSTILGGICSNGLAIGCEVN